MLSLLNDITEKQKFKLSKEVSDSKICLVKINFYMANTRTLHL